MSDDRLDDLLRVDVSQTPSTRRRRSGAAAPVEEGHEPEEPGARRRFPIVIVALWCIGVVLAVTGFRVVANSTSGRSVDLVDDPDAPGFEALVDATPTLALLTVDGDDLVGIAVVSLTHADAGGGAVVLVPQRTIDDLAVFGRSPLDVSWALGDERSLVDALGVLVGFAVPERAVVDDRRWAELVSPVGSVSIDNPNELSLDGEVRFDIGEIELAPDDVGPFLRARAEDESDLERLYRHELFFTAWIDAIAAHGGVDAVPGELESGVGYFMRTLAAGDADVMTLPVEVDTSEEFGPADAYEVTDDAADVVARHVPFPRSPEPGARPRVRVLNGTVDDRAADVAPQLPPAGVEIVIVGNAPELGDDATSIRYGLPEFADDARRIAAILDVADVARDDHVSDAYDITVTLGPDASPKT